MNEFIRLHIEGDDDLYISDNFLNRDTTKMSIYNSYYKHNEVSRRSSILSNFGLFFYLGVSKLLFVLLVISFPTVYMNQSLGIYICNLGRNILFQTYMLLLEKSGTNIINNAFDFFSNAIYKM